MTLVLDQDLRIVKANRSFYEFFKVSSHETIGKLIYELGNQQWDIPKLRELLKTVLPGKETFDNYEVEHEFSIIGKRIMLLNARQIERAFGKEKIILLAIEDVTERMQLEELLTESEERYRRLFETADDGILLLDKRDGNITHANPAIQGMLMYTKDECIGKKLKDIGFLLAGDDIQDIMQELNKCGIVNYDDVAVQTKAGLTVYTDIYMVDRSMLVQCNIRDITEHKRVTEALRESEKKFRTITENSADAIFIADQQGNYVYVNQAASDLLGYPLDKFMTMNIADLSSPDEIKQDIEEYQKLQSEGRLYTEKSLRKADGTFVHVDLNSVLLPNGLTYGSCRDITERKQAEKQIKKDLNEKEILLQELYHRTKNNMQVICSMLRLKSSTLADQGIRELFKEIETRIHSMALVHQILIRSKDLSHLDLKDYFDFSLTVDRRSTLISHCFC